VVSVCCLPEHALPTRGCTLLFLPVTANPLMGMAATSSLRNLRRPRASPRHTQRLFASLVLFSLVTCSGISFDAQIRRCFALSAFLIALYTAVLTCWRLLPNSHPLLLRGSCSRLFCLFSGYVVFILLFIHLLSCLPLHTLPFSWVRLASLAYLWNFCCHLTSSWRFKHCRVQCYHCRLYVTSLPSATSQVHRALAALSILPQYPLARRCLLPFNNIYLPVNITSSSTCIRHSYV